MPELTRAAGAAVLTLDDWFEEFIAEHRSRFAGAGLPEPWDEAAGGASLFWSVWYERFRDLAIGRDVASEASKRLAVGPPRFPNEHLGRLLKLCAAIEAERQSGSIAAKALEHRAAQDRRRRARDRWDALPEAERDRLAGAKARECPDVMARFLVGLVLQDLESDEIAPHGAGRREP